MLGPETLQRSGQTSSLPRTWAEGGLNPGFFAMAPCAESRAPAAPTAAVNHAEATMVAGCHWWLGQWPGRLSGQDVEGKSNECGEEKMRPEQNECEEGYQ